MNCNPAKTICLSIFIRNGTEHLERCLRSALPFVDAWSIIDFSAGQDDGYEEIVQNISQIPGKYSRLPFIGYAHAQNTALVIAGEFAQFSLRLEADEELMVLGDGVLGNNEIEVGLLEVEHAGYHLREPRLLSCHSDIKYEYSMAERIVEQPQYRQGVIERVAIICHADDVWRTANTNRDHQLLKAELNKHPNCAHLNLALGQNSLRQNKLDSAQVFFSQAGELAQDQNILWLSNYFHANILLDHGELEPAKLLLQKCIEQAPERAEPYLQLAIEFDKSGRVEAAIELCEVIADFEVPKAVEYFEPSVYRYSAKLRLAELYFKFDRFEDALKLAQYLSTLQDLPTIDRQRVEWLINQKECADLPVKQTLNSNLPGKRVNTAQSETPKPVLTIGMATYDDFDGVYFSVMSILLYHPGITDEIEILVIDNNPESKHGKAVQEFCKCSNTIRYVSASEYQGTTIRERIFAEARGDYVLSIDCHVFLHPNAISSLLDYFKTNPNSRDLVHGPMINEDGRGFSTHMDPVWRAGFFGTYKTDERGGNPDNQPFEIPMQGLGLFTCRKSAWPGFNRKFRGFGGEEGYIHEKFRRNGGRIICLPSLRWTHRFFRPAGTKYLNIWEDRIRNYLIGWDELGLDKSALFEHFSGQVNRQVTAKCNASFRAERAGPLWSFDTIFLLSENDQQWSKIQTSLTDLSIERVAMQLPLVITSSATRSICIAESQLQALNIASKQNLDNIVIIDYPNTLEISLRVAIKQKLNQIETQPYDCAFISVEIKPMDKLVPPLKLEITIIQNAAYASLTTLLKQKRKLSVALVKSFDAGLRLLEV